MEREPEILHKNKLQLTVSFLRGSSMNEIMENAKRTQTLTFEKADKSDYTLNEVTTAIGQYGASHVIRGEVMAVLIPEPHDPKDTICRALVFIGPPEYLKSLLKTFEKHYGEGSLSKSIHKLVRVLENGEVTSETDTSKSDGHSSDRGKSSFSELGCFMFQDENRISPTSPDGDLDSEIYVTSNY